MSNWIVNEYGSIGVEGMQNNARIIDEYFTMLGWSKNAIAAILGNMEAESGINPARWENDDIGNLSDGFGLVQWTPATKLITWIEGQYIIGELPSNNSYDGTNQLTRIIYELNNDLQYAETRLFPESFREWTVSGKNPGYLGAAFMANYERPEKQNYGVQIQRAKNARKWYIFLTGVDLGAWIPPGFLAILKKSVDNQKGGF